MTIHAPGNPISVVGNDQSGTNGRDCSWKKQNNFDEV